MAEMNDTEERQNTKWDNLLTSVWGYSLSWLWKSLEDCLTLLLHHLNPYLVPSLLPAAQQFFAYLTNELLINY